MYFGYRTGREPVINITTRELQKPMDGPADTYKEHFNMGIGPF